jgi:hypothetical protein
MVPVAVHLTALPRPSRDGKTIVMVTGRVRNLTDRPLDTRVHMSDLLVDGVPWPSWSLAIGNGTIDPRLVELPSGEEASFSRELDVSSLPPGRHVLVLRVLGVESNPVPH